MLDRNIYTSSNDLIWHPGHLFTFGTRREGTYLRQGSYMYSAQGTCMYFFFEKTTKTLTLIQYELPLIGTLTAL